MATTQNPYAAPKAAIDDVQTSAPELATRGERFAASFVDGLSFMVPGLVAAFAGPASGKGLGVGVMVILAGLAILALFGINLWMLNRNGQTLGKRVLKIRVTRSDGSDAGLARLIFLRGLPQWIVSSIPFVNLLYFVDLLFIFGAAHRCVHDYIADTVVVKAG